MKILNVKLKLNKFYKTMSLTALLLAFFSATSFAQCITGGNGSETAIFSTNTGGFTVTNPDSATDASLLTRTILNVPFSVLGGGTHLAINFTKGVNPGDTIYVILGQGTGGLGTSVLSQTSATAYESPATSTDPSVGTACGTAAASSLISVINILGQAYQALPVIVTGTAGAESLDISATALISLGFTVNIYGVYVTPGPVTPLTTSCSANKINARKYTASNNGTTLQWYAANDTTSTLVFSTTGTGAPYVSTYTIAPTHTYYVREATQNCGLYSKLVAVSSPTTVTPLTNLNFTSNCSGGTATLTSAVTGGTGTYTYAWTLTGGSGGTLTNTTLANATLTGNPASGTITLTVVDVYGGCQLTVSKTFTKTNTGTGCVTFGTTVLPAIGLNLGGSLVNGKPVLTWGTLQEINTSYYSVEASTDGSSFTALGKVAAAGNSSTPSSYTFTDVTSTGTLVYYRVKLVDIDGGITYSNVFTLRLSGSILAKIYPNPVTNLVNIETGTPGTYVAELFTVDGKKVISTQIATASGLVTLTIDRANVTSGVYMLKMTSKTSAVSTYNTIMVK